MKKLRTVLTAAILCALFQCLVFAANADMAVKVFKYAGDEEVIVYQGPLGAYDNGLWDSFDFSRAQVLMIVDWDQADADILYMVPDNGTDEPVLNPSDTAEIYQNGILDAALNGVEIDLSLLYNNAFSECVLQEGQQLTAEIKLLNTNENSRAVNSIIALYDASSKLIAVNTENVTIPGGGKETMQNKIVVPMGNTAENAKIMLWDSMSGMNPYAAPLVLTLAGQDFFGDDYTLAQPISGKNKANGILNTLDDTDVFSITPANDGLYYFEAFSEVDTYASLYAEGEMGTPVAEDDDSGYGDNFRLSATLQANTTYYLYVRGRAAGRYTLNYGYEIGNIYGTVSPVSFYDDDTVYNELAETTVTFKNYGTDEFVAAMHLKDWSQSNTPYASFSLSGVHAGEYLVEISRPGYLTRYKKILLRDNVIDLGSTALLAGDVNGDLVVNQQDVQAVSVLLGTQYGEPGYRVHADLNGDKVIDQLDLAMVNENLGMDANGYDGDINVIAMRTEVQDNILGIAGKARANSLVTCTVYYDDYSIFEAEAACGVNGDFSFAAELNKSGSYLVVVTAENQAFAASSAIEY